MFGDVSATPTVVNGTVYVVDWGDLDYFKFTVGPYLTGNGHLTAIDADTGSSVKQNLAILSFSIARPSGSRQAERSTVQE